MQPLAPSVRPADAVPAPPPLAAAAGGTSPEMALLLAVGRRVLDDASRDAMLAAVRGGVDWERTLALAFRHNLLQLLVHHVSRTDEVRALIPDETRRALRAASIAGIRGSMELAGELRRLLRLFEAGEVGILPLKGPVLAELLYGSVALRLSGDLDVLVATAELERAGGVLRSAGYVAADTWTSPQAALALRLGHHQSFVHPTGGWRVELHHRLTAPVGRFDADRVRVADALRPSEFSGVAVTVLAPEALLVYLCVHGSVHAWERLEWLSGVAELLRTGLVTDWGRVVAIAERLGATRRVEAAVYLAGALLQAPQAGAAIRPPDAAARRAADDVMARLLGRPDVAPTERETLAFLRGTDPDLATTIDRYRRALFTPHPADLLAFPLPKPLHAFYGVARPIRLAWRAGLRAVGRASAR